MVPQTFALLLAVSGPLTEAKTPWFQIGYSGGGLGVSFSGHMSFQRVTGIKNNELDPSVPPRWEADLYTEDRDLNGKVTKRHQRADARTCPGLDTSLQLFSTIPALKPQAPNNITEQWLPAPPADGAAFYYNRYGRLTGSDDLYSEGFGDAPGRLLQPVWTKVSALMKPCWANAPDSSQ